MSAVPFAPAGQRARRSALRSQSSDEPKFLRPPRETASASVLYERSSIHRSRDDERELQRGHADGLRASSTSETVHESQLPQAVLRGLALPPRTLVWRSEEL